MYKNLVLLAISTALSTSGWAQIKKQFSVDDQNQCTLVNVNIKATTGNCFIRPSQSTELLTVYGNQDLETYAHSFSKEVKNRECNISLDLEENSAQGLSRNISYRVFGSKPADNAQQTSWKMYFTENKPYNLDLYYGLGNANIDLSGLAVKNLKINSGSADVFLGYFSGVANKMEMDTLLVKVELGSISVKRLNLTRSKYVMAEVGFGNMTLDFSDPIDAGKYVKGRVGAGNLLILLPAEEVPVLIKITDSWLCKVNMLPNYKKIGDNTFVNAAYTKDATNLMRFDLDVSMGNISFKEKSAN